MMPSPSSPPISQGPPPGAGGPPPGAGGPPPAPAPAAPATNSLSLDPNLLSKAKGPHECKPGDVYKVSLTVRANSSGGFDVMDTEPMQKTDSATGSYKDDSAVDPGSDEEEELLGYKRPVKKGPALI